jgi:hypothetical protein
MIPLRQSILGRRRLSVLGEERRRFVTVTLMTPEREEPEIWNCELRISGAGLRLKRRIRGADALQAIQLAFHVASKTLDASGLRLSWGKPEEQGTAKPEDWTGFDRPLPHFLGTDGVERNQRVRRFIQREQESSARATLARITADYERRGIEVPPDIRAAHEREAGMENPGDGD